MRTVHLYDTQSPIGTACRQHKNGQDMTKIHESVNCEDCLHIMNQENFKKNTLEDLNKNFTKAVFKRSKVLNVAE